MAKRPSGTVFATAQGRYLQSLEAAWRAGDEVEACYELQGHGDERGRPWSRGRG